MVLIMQLWPLPDPIHLPPQSFRCVLETFSPWSTQSPPPSNSSLHALAFSCPATEPWPTPEGSTSAHSTEAAPPTGSRVKGVPGAPHQLIVPQIIAPQHSCETPALAGVLHPCTERAFLPYLCHYGCLGPFLYVLTASAAGSPSSSLSQVPSFCVTATLLSLASHIQGLLIFTNLYFNPIFILLECAISWNCTPLK